MLPRPHCFFLALTAALLIVFGTFGIFTAEASSVMSIVSEVQTYGTVLPLDANDTGLAGPAAVSVPGLSY